MKLPRMVSNFLDAPAIPAPVVKAQRSAALAAILDAQARVGRFSTETVDTEGAYRLAMVTTWVASAIHLIANRATTEAAALKVQRGRGKNAVDVENHPLTPLLDRPNSFMSGTFLRKYTIQWLLLRGNAYEFLATTAPGRGPVQEILPLQANYVRPMPETLHDGRGLFRGKMVIDYEYNVAGQLQTLPGENIVHYRMPNPFDWWEGMSPLTGALLAIQLDYAQKIWQRDFFDKENAIPSAIISAPQDVSEPDFRRMVETVKAQLDEGKKRLFTRAGDLSVNVISQTLEQMQILESRKFTRDEIDRAFLIPDGIFSGNLSGDSRDRADLALARNAVQPLLDDLADQLSQDAMPYYADREPSGRGAENVYVAAPNIVPQDRALAIQETTIYGQDRSINENRAVRGEKPWRPKSKTLRAYGEIPVRLLPLVQAGIIDLGSPNGGGPTAPPNGSREPSGRGVEAEQEAPGVGSLPGSQVPAAMLAQMAGKGALNGTVPVQDVAWRAEAKQFRKWARSRLPEVDVGEFTAVVLTAADKAAILEELQEQEGAGAQDAPFPAVLGWEQYP